MLCRAIQDGWVTVENSDKMQSTAGGRANPCKSCCKSLINSMKSQKDKTPEGETLHSQEKKRLGTDCGSDHELLIAKFRHKLKTVGKTTRPFRYDLNQILYNYRVETNRFKGLHLIDRVLEELWAEIHCTVQEAVVRPS